MNDDFDKLQATENFTVDDVEVVEKVRAHDGYFKVDRYQLRHRKHEGGWTEVMSREIFERGHATAVFLFDPELDKVVFIEQFRPGAFAAFNSPWFDAKTHSPWVLECVAGIIDEGESPEDVARRECIEEANCAVVDMVPITHYLASPGGTTESIFLFCARIDASNVGGVHGLEHEHEDIRVISVDTDTAMAWLDQGRFINAMTLIAMQWFKLNLSDLRARWS
ncbi:NUDIX domain-containing protein [Magnetovibrio sp.]|uniref:NUDIX domain-containing protein n=1 Tax=Magnetovibrio sp. TaxID=2024836 RepID=UPI002F948DCD